jgi:hypothetical protein
MPAPAEGGRVETGAVQFGDDWPGLFIRGDNAGWMAMQLRSLEGALERKDYHQAKWHFAQVEWLIDGVRNDVIVKPSE